MTKPRNLNEFEAKQFAALVLAGVPAIEVAGYFMPPDAAEEQVQFAARQWARQREVAAYVEAMSGGPWAEMTPEARFNAGLDKLYAEMAFFLWSHNYAELQGTDKQKADTCRLALESKLAGTAGSGSVLDRVYEDVLRSYKAQVKGTVN